VFGVPLDQMTPDVRRKAKVQHALQYALPHALLLALPHALLLALLLVLLLALVHGSRPHGCQFVPWPHRRVPARAALPSAPCPP
jgi:hypothetical protein